MGYGPMYVRLAIHGCYVEGKDEGRGP